jgi:hypothetical protein
MTGRKHQLKQPPTADHTIHMSGRWLCLLMTLPTRSGLLGSQRLSAGTTSKTTCQQTSSLHRSQLSHKQVLQAKLCWTSPFRLSSIPAPALQRLANTERPLPKPPMNPPSNFLFKNLSKRLAMLPMLFLLKAPTPPQKGWRVKMEDVPSLGANGPTWFILAGYDTYLGSGENVFLL